MSDLENSTTIRIGDLLERAGLVTSADLTEAVSVSKRLQLPIGRVLIMSGCVTERILKSAIEAQSLIRDRGVNLGKALETLVRVAEEDISFQDALKKTDPARGPGSSTNRLGEILIEFGLINNEQLKEALVISAESGMQLGATLVSMNLLSPMLLPLLLRTQEQIREGVITRQQAAVEFRSSYAMWTKAEESFRETGSGTDLQTHFAQAMQKAQDPHEAFFKQFGHPAQPTAPATGQYPMPQAPYGMPPGYPMPPPGYPGYPINQQGYPQYPYPNQYPPGAWQGTGQEHMPPPANPYGAPPQWPPTQFQNPNSMVPQPSANIQPHTGGYSVPPSQANQPYPGQPHPGQQHPGQQHPGQHPGQSDAPPPAPPTNEPQKAQWQSPPVHAGPMPPFSQAQAPAPTQEAPPMPSLPQTAHPASRAANTRLPALNAQAGPNQAAPHQAAPNQGAPNRAAPNPPVAPGQQPGIHNQAPAQNWQAPAAAQPPVHAEQPSQPPSAPAKPAIPAFERVINRKLKSNAGDVTAESEAEKAANKPNKRPTAKPAEVEPTTATKPTGEATVRLSDNEIERFLDVVDHAPDTAGSATASVPPPAAQPDPQFAAAREDDLTETLKAFCESVELDLDVEFVDANKLKREVRTYEIDALPSSQYDTRRVADVETVIDYDAFPNSGSEQTIETSEIYEAGVQAELGAEEDTLIDYEPIPIKSAADALSDDTKPTLEMPAVPELADALSDDTKPTLEMPAITELSAVTLDNAPSAAEVLESDIDTLIDYEPNPGGAHEQEKLVQADTAGPQISQPTLSADATQAEVVPEPTLHMPVQATASTGTNESSELANSMSDVLAELRAVQEQLEIALDFNPETFAEAQSTKYSAFAFDFPAPAFAEPPGQADVTAEKPTDSPTVTNHLTTTEDTPTIAELPVINFRLGNTLTNIEAAETLDSRDALALEKTTAEIASGESTGPQEKSVKAESVDTQDQEGGELLTLFTTVLKSQDVRKHSRLNGAATKTWSNGHDKTEGNGFEKFDKKQRGKTRSKSDRIKHVADEGLDVTLQGVRIQSESIKMDVETRKVKGDKPKDRRRAKRKREEEAKQESKQRQEDAAKQHEEEARQREEEAKPLVDILISAGYFNQKDLEDAFAQALKKTSALPELLLLLGIINDDSHSNVNRCQAMLTSGLLKPTQAIQLLSAIKEGKTFDEAMDEHHITSSASI